MNETFERVKRAFPSLFKQSLEEPSLKYDFANYFHNFLRYNEFKNWKKIFLNILLNWGILLLNKKDLDDFNNFKSELKNHVLKRWDMFNPNFNQYKYLTALWHILESTELKPGTYPNFKYDDIKGQVILVEILPFKIIDNSKFGGFNDTSKLRSVENLIKQQDKKIMGIFSRFYKTYITHEYRITKFKKQSRKSPSPKNYKGYQSRPSKSVSPIFSEENSKLKQENDNLKNNLKFMEDHIVEKDSIIEKQKLILIQNTESIKSKDIEIFNLKTLIEKLQKNLAIKDEQISQYKIDNHNMNGVINMVKDTVNNIPNYSSNLDSNSPVFSPQNFRSNEPKTISSPIMKTNNDFNSLPVNNFGNISSSFSDKFDSIGISNDVNIFSNQLTSQPKAPFQNSFFNRPGSNLPPGF